MRKITQSFAAAATIAVLTTTASAEDLEGYELRTDCKLSMLQIYCPIIEHPVIGAPPENWWSTPPIFGDPVGGDFYTIDEFVAQIRKAAKDSGRKYIKSPPISELNTITPGALSPLIIAPPEQLLRYEQFNKNTLKLREQLQEQNQ